MKLAKNKENLACLTANRLPADGDLTLGSYGTLSSPLFPMLRKAADVTHQWRERCFELLAGP